MHLGEFYNQTENMIINNLIYYFRNINPLKEVKILNIYDSSENQVDELFNFTDLRFIDNSAFLDNIEVYKNSLNGKKFDIINCRFSLKCFMSNRESLTKFVDFVADMLEENGYFMGFMLDTNQINGIFATTTYMTNGLYRLEYFGQMIDDKLPVLINGELLEIINFDTLKLICFQNGLRHIDNVILESLHRNSLSGINLTTPEKQFGYLNYVFIFQKI